MLRLGRRAVLLGFVLVSCSDKPASTQSSEALRPVVGTDTGPSSTDHTTEVSEPTPLATASTTPASADSAAPEIEPDLASGVEVASANLPPGWTVAAGEIYTKPGAPRRIDSDGCQHDDEFALLADLGSIGFAQSRAFTDARGRRAWVAIYQFASAATATEFLDRTVSATLTCPRGYDDRQPENVFGRLSDSDHQDAVWSIHRDATATRTDVNDVDTVVVTTVINYIADIDGGVDQGTTANIVQAEAHGPLVTIVALSGDCCQRGFGGDSLRVEYRPTADDLAALADHFRPLLLSAIPDEQPG